MKLNTQSPSWQQYTYYYCYSLEHLSQVFLCCNLVSFHASLLIPCNEFAQLFTRLVVYFVPIHLCISYPFLMIIVMLLLPCTQFNQSNVWSAIKQWFLGYCSISVSPFSYYHCFSALSSTSLHQMTALLAAASFPLPIHQVKCQWVCTPGSWRGKSSMN